MTVDEDYDVVVIGFGAAGAAAAAEAARCGATVLVLDRRSPVRLDRATWAAMRTAGIDVRGQTSVHELVVEAGEVTGVGCEGLDPRTPAGARFWWLERCAVWLNSLSPRLAGAVQRAAENTWQDRATLGAVRCRSVVLATPRSSWDIVGPAIWSATAACTPSPSARRLAAVPDGGPTAEFLVRSWCAVQSGRGVDPGHGELELDTLSGAVRVGRDLPVPGLFAVEVDPGRGPVGRHLRRAQEAGRRVGGSAAVARRPASRGLRSVG